jgi:predicted heme/steroid binding protein
MELPDDPAQEPLPELSAEELAALPVLTLRQLALRNGQDREEIYVGFRGLVYDVSESRRWLRGNHYGHWAGQDLTPELAQAPHTDWVFRRFRPIARLG